MELKRRRRKKSGRGERFRRSLKSGGAGGNVEEKERFRRRLKPVSEFV